jgi:ParB/RepB/Spo0J family partition protein
MKDERIVEIPINLIKKLDNSRLRIQETDLVPLMEDIKHRGLLQPIGVIKEGETFIIRFGNRRLEACKKLGWQSIPAMISEREIDEDSFMADNIAENLHRVDLSPIELANQCKSFIARGYSVSEIASILSVPKQKIASCIFIEKSAPETFKRAISNIKHEDRTNKKGKVSATVANEILTFSNYLSDKQKEKLFDEAKKNELSGGQIRLIKNMIRNGMTLEQAVEKYKDFKMCAVELPLKIEELEKYKMDLHSMFKGFIDGSVKSNKKLLPNY